MSTGTKRTATQAGFDIDALIKNDEKAKNKSSAARSREMQGGGADGKKHSLDSDEEIEDNEVEGEKLHDDDIEGQEDITIEKDGEVKISAEERATKDYMSIQEAENLGCKGTILKCSYYFMCNI